MIRKCLRFAMIFMVVCSIGHVIAYFLLSSQEMLRTITPFLPPRSRCDIVSMDTTTYLTRAQHQALDRLLRTRYAEAYQSLDDVPDSTWNREPLDVCEIKWTRANSGLFWFKASYSVKKADVESGVEETYVWVLFKWVKLSERLFGEQYQVVFSAA